MKRSRFSEEQIISILKEQEAGTATAKVCRRHGISPATFYKWKSKFGGMDVSEAKHLRALEDERRRFGYRCLGYLLAREGIAPNHKKLLRIYREAGLRVRRRGGRKRALGTRAPMMIPQGPNQRWSLDFVSDSFVCGRRFRILCVVDDFSRECLAMVADTSISSARVARELTTIIGQRGKPHMIVSDNGRTLALTGNNQGSTSGALSLWGLQP
jgi:putative transposase